MKIVVLGCNGMVGFEAIRSLLPVGDVIGLTREQADLGDLAALEATVERIAPDVIVNAAAYTEVDRAESDRSTADRINGDAVGALARIARQRAALLIHYSTDYVFDGGNTVAWQEDDLPSPVNAYGESKLLGERALADSGADWLCIRTSWVYASRGKNFVRTILRLAGEREELRVIDDQHGVPTSARNLADATAQVVRMAMSERQAGTFRSSLLHYVPAGCTTWHGVAEEVVSIAKQRSSPGTLLAQRILPIVTSDFPTAARRPANSRLSTSWIQQRYGIAIPDWRIPLHRCMEELL